MEAVQSVLEQSYPSFELILIDDGSTDGSLALAMALTDPRIRIIRHTQNRGAAAARNSGVQSATAPLIAFLDSDDVWQKNKLERHLPFHRSCGAAVTCTSFEMIRENGGRTIKNLPENNDWKSAFLYGCHVGPGSTLIAERAVFERVGYLDESLKRLEDWDWLLRLVRTERFAALDEVLTEVRVKGYPAYRPATEAIKKIITLHKPFLAENPVAWQAFKSGAYIECAYVSFHNDHYVRMLLNLLKAFTSSPAGFAVSARRIISGRLKSSSTRCQQANIPP